VEGITIYKEIKKKDIDKILEYLPYFKDKTNSFYTIESENYFDPYSYSGRVNQFIDTLYKHNFIISYDYPSWQPEAIKYVEDPKLLESADLLTLQKLLTLHVRKERFCSGHLASVIDEGHLLKILERLKKLRLKVV
jgi:O-acetyl-ADP-ribose deacetylase